MKASDYIAQFLHKNSLNIVFEMIGGMTTHLIDSIYQTKKIKIISLHHEQSAGFAAEGFGRITGLPGVAIATSGPGATNLVTAVGSCYFDSVPVIFITGQVNTLEQRPTGSQIRQLGFQETDIVSIVKPITKYAQKIERLEEIPDALEKAFKISLEGRPGPVLIDIPMNLQRGELEGEPSEMNPPEDAESQISDVILQEMIASIKKSKQPLILVGGGIRSSRTQDDLKKFVLCTKIPVVYSLMGWDAFYDENLRIGFIGSYGNRWANLALSECDLLIVLGSRLDVRQTGSQTDDFVSGKKIYHVDCVSDEINNRIKGSISIHSTLQHFFDRMKHALSVSPCSFEDTKGWLLKINALREKYSDVDEIKDIKGINPNFFLKILSKEVPDTWHYVTDVGQHQMWAAQSLIPKTHQRFITSGGMGAMGFGLPTAIGVHFSSDRPVVLIAGDGGFQCNIQELETISNHEIPVKIIVINNHSLGMVRQFQESYFDNRFQGTVWGYSSPSFENVAKAYNIPALTVDSTQDLMTSIKWLLEGKGPQLLEVHISTETPVNPKLLFGQPLSKMSPSVN